MIKTLRRKFIAISMCSMAVVLFLLIGGINLVNYHNVNRTADARLDILTENGGYFPKKPLRTPEAFHQMSKEAPFDTRFFTVVLHSDGSVASVDTGKIAAVSTQDACDYASFLWQKQSRQGYYGHYKYRAVSVSGTGGVSNTLYIFLDCERELNSFRAFLAASTAASLLGILSVFVLVVFFSKILVKPVAESYEKQKRFITDASHELKTPLTIIDANVEVLEMEQGENEWTASIHNQVKRLSSLTQKLVFLSRMNEENSSLFTMLDFFLSDAVSETAQPFLTLAETAGKQLTLKIAPGISYCGDEAALRQLTSLLLDNALKYASENSDILLTLKESGKNKILTVQNKAEGIPAGNLDILFDRFYRTDISRNSSTGGFGIGLSVAKAIVTAHKGKIFAKSEDGETILFTVIL
ncbi:MAG: HAMP domain-containing histidine kinase [Lachnoclostridium sp.]|nr:HAMP domain-containing histidine kinase [Lachnospira sp.]MCM1246980.1 HAMP domain-containing histidine kinase [Lachnoclostridium sp.]MCM1535033.1 HAMP domain-containing histidine kinase [Clostridium sp.]